MVIVNEVEVGMMEVVMGAEAGALEEGEVGETIKKENGMMIGLEIQVGVDVEGVGSSIAVLFLWLVSFCFAR